jgi:hypothetical protein
MLVLRVALVPEGILAGLRGPVLCARDVAAGGVATPSAAHAGATAATVAAVVGGGAGTGPALVTIAQFL